MKKQIDVEFVNAHGETLFKKKTQSFRKKTFISNNAPLYSPKKTN